MGGVVGKVLSPLIGDTTGQDASNAANNAAGLAAQGQREQLDYMKQVEQLPLEMRDKFLPQLADIYSGGQGQQNLINSAMQSPLYKQLIGNQQYGEDAIMRNASATGGLRSGDASRALNEYNVRSTNEALTQAYGGQLRGIEGLAGIGLNTNAIGNAISAPSSTLAQGQIAGAQAKQQATQGAMDLLGGLGGASLMAPKGTFSDIRAKGNIEYIGEENGHSIFKWTWNKAGEALGLKGESRGVMAHLVAEYMPEAIDISNGFLMVNYEMLGLEEIH